jgi:tRNA U34 5-methylaminomethyl-2-thiouridine-forming methyltransferase MnmC
MNTQVVVTADGSHSMLNTELGQHYHSIYGAIQESERVFIELGLTHAFATFEGPIRVFEMGFGTGLNTLMSIREAMRHRRLIDYVAVEAYPIDATEGKALNYDSQLTTFWLNDIHDAPWNVPTSITPWFTLTKYRSQLQDQPNVGPFHVVYYDAFAPEGQPELWTTEVFAQLAQCSTPVAY